MNDKKAIELPKENDHMLGEDWKDSKFINTLKFFVEHWKPACAFIYSLVILADFIVFPAYAGIAKMPIEDMVTATKGVDKDVALALIEKAYRSYEPYTLKGGGMFHLALGALLTGAAVTKNNSVFQGKK